MPEELVVQLQGQRVIFIQIGHAAFVIKIFIMLILFILRGDARKLVTFRINAYFDFSASLLS